MFSSAMNNALLVDPNPPKIRTKLWFWTPSHPKYKLRSRNRRHVAQNINKTLIVDFKAHRI